MAEIIVEQLVKQYKDFKAVDGISLHIKAGEMFGFLGPNGAGKSTTVTMLTTLVLPTAGRATIGGYNVVTQANDVRRITGVALQEVGLDKLMKSRELLSIQGQLFGMSYKESHKRADELLALVKLDDPQVVDRQVGTYSGGMRRRLDLALALVHQPQTLFLDEPTTGLDPASRRDIWTEVRRLNREYGITIFLTTQYLEEADELADRIAIINKGTIVAEGQPAELKAALGGESINLTFRDATQAEQAQTLLGVMFNRMQLDRKVLRLYRNNAAEIVPDVMSTLQHQRLAPIALTLTQPTLDDVFLQVTGQTFADDKEKSAH
jgi:ABC-2 type transport system ATP-binding protein